jgi:glycosyltransferase involved in cell wall biosynthesis
VKLSVVVPIYNAEAYLEECLNSLIVDNKDIEYILINDGSKDSSYKICEKYKNENVQLFNNKNKGVSYSRNFGVEHASGKWVMFLDSDDLLSDGWDKTIEKYFDCDDDVIFFSSFLDENINNRKEILLQCMGYENNNNNFASPWSKIYRRNFLQEERITFNNNIINGEDMLFNCTCILNSKNISIKKEQIYKYRISCGSSTKKWKDVYISSDFEFRKKLYELLNKSNLFSKKELKNIEGFIDSNAKIGILQRLAFSRDYKLFKKKAIEIRQCLFKRSNKITIRKKIILILFYFKLYRPIYDIYLFKIDQLKKMGDYFVNI